MAILEGIRLVRHEKSSTYFKTRKSFDKDAYVSWSEPGLRLAPADAKTRFPNGLAADRRSAGRPPIGRSTFGNHESEKPMKTRWTLVLLLAAAFVSRTQAQTPWQFRWQKGQILAYRVKHDTTVTEVVAGGKQQYGSHLALTKRYHVLDVDAQGIATLEYRVTAMRNEQTRPDGEVLLFDSADLAKSTPTIRDQLAKYVGTTLAVLRVNPAGNVIAVKQGPADRYAAEPPFTLVLPGVPLLEGMSWRRSFDVTLNPPLGTGEKYSAEQECRCAKFTDGNATVALKTAFKSMPASVQEQIPLVPKELSGEVIFEVTAGHVIAVRLGVDRTLENHQGAGSSYRFQSTYTEEFLRD
jgi:hypothetical protein